MQPFSFIILAVGVGLYWLMIRWIIHHKIILAKPPAEQKRLKNQLYLSLAIIVVAYSVTQWLITSKTTGWLPWLFIALYLLLWAVSAYLMRKAYCIGIKKDLSQVKKLNGQPFLSPQQFTSALGFTDFFTGLAIMLFAIAVPLFGIQMTAWAPCIFVIATLRQLVYSRFEKKDAAGLGS